MKHQNESFTFSRVWFNVFFFRCFDLEWKANRNPSKEGTWPPQAKVPDKPRPPLRWMRLPKVFVSILREAQQRIKAQQ